jgi:hypothetical protein
VDITQNPGVGGATSSTSTTAGSTGNSTVVSSGAGGAAQSNPTVSATVAGSTIAAVPSGATSSSGGFKLANGQAAQKLNVQFATLTDASSCTGEFSFRIKMTFNSKYFLQRVPMHASVALLRSV